MELETVGDIIPVGSSFFQSMAGSSIWGTMNMQGVDVDLLLHVGNLPASPLLKHYRGDIPLLATNVYAKYNTNWKRIWDTVTATYETFITSESTETFTSETIESKDIERNVSRETTENNTVTVDDTTVTDGTIGTTGTSSNNNTNQVNRFGMGSGGSGSPESNTTDNSSGNSSSTENNDTTVTTDTSTVGSNEIDSTEIDTTDIDGTVTVTETRTIKGSSPLRTYQALIDEELAGRSGVAWNAFQLMINDVRNELALKIWA